MSGRPRRMPTRLISDNVMVRFEIHERNGVTDGGIHIPDTFREKGHRVTEGVLATVVLAGPGRHAMSVFRKAHGYFERAEMGDVIPMEPSIRPGARVIVDGKNVGDRWYDSNMQEHRIIRETDIVAVLEP